MDPPRRRDIRMHLHKSSELGMNHKVIISNSRDAHASWNSRLTRNSAYPGKRRQKRKMRVVVSHENAKLLSRVRDFSVWSFRSRDISVRVWNLVEILHVHFFMQMYLNQRNVLLKKTTKTTQDPTVSQHQHMIFIVISKQIKSLSTFCN